MFNMFGVIEFRPKIRIKTITPHLWYVAGMLMLPLTGPYAFCK